MKTKHTAKLWGVERTTSHGKPELIDARMDRDLAAELADKAQQAAYDLGKNWTYRVVRLAGSWEGESK